MRAWLWVTDPAAPAVDAVLRRKTLPEASTRRYPPGAATMPTTTAANGSGALPMLRASPKPNTHQQPLLLTSSQSWKKTSDGKSPGV